MPTSRQGLVGGALAPGLGSIEMVHWPLVRSSELFELRYGKALVASGRRPGSVPVYGTNGQTGSHDSPLFRGPGLILGRKGAGHLGVHWTDNDYWVIDTAYSLSPRDDVDLKFAYYLIKHVGLNHLKHGTSNPSLTRDAFGAQYFPLPPVATQGAIATTLSALDDMIDSNRRKIDLLEELGAAIVEQRLHLDAYGFPEYERGRRLGDVLRVLETGSRPKGGAAPSGSGVVSLGAESIQSAGVCTTNVFKHIPEEFAARMKRGHLEEEDVLVYKDGGRPGNFIPHVSAFGYGFPVEEAAINEHVYRVRSSDGISQALLYWLLRSPWMDQEMRKRGTGVAIPGLNSSNFRDLPLPILTETDVEVLNDRLSPVLASMLRLGTESGRLAALRNVLLPELLTGRIRVPEAELTIDSFA